jgi:hypothetical protein
MPVLRRFTGLPRSVGLCITFGFDAAPALLRANHAMNRSIAIATLLVLPDLRPLGQRLAAVLRHLSIGAAEDLHRDAERLGRAVVFQGDPAEAEQLRRELKAAGLTTSLNLRLERGAAA